MNISEPPASEANHKNWLQTTFGQIFPHINVTGIKANSSLDNPVQN